LHISHEKVAEILVVDSSDFPCLLILISPLELILFGSAVPS
jgi:hypothetical protein